MSFIATETSEKRDFSGYTLILPTVSIGNVAQLSVDLILSSYPGVRRVGMYYDPENVEPYAAPDPLAIKTKDVKGVLGFGIEIYEDPTRKLVIWQQRVPAIVGRLQAFTEGVVKFIVNQHFDRVILLTSDFNYDRTDEQLMRHQTFAYFATSNLVDKLKSELEGKLGWDYAKPHENAYAGSRYEQGAENVPRRGYGDIDDVTEELPTFKADEKKEAKQDRTSSSSSVTTKREDEKKFIAVGHGGAASIAKICEDKGIPLVGLVALTTEGDNTDDAIQLADKLQRLLETFPHVPDLATHLNGIKWNRPLAWKYVYGGDTTSEGIYT